MYRHHLEKLVRTRLDDIVVAEGLLDRARLEAAQAEQDQSGKLLSDVLLDAETIDEWDLAKLVAGHNSLPFVDVSLCSIPTQVLDLLPLEWCRSHSVLPFDQFGKTIGLACVEVPPAEVVEEITTRTGCMPFIYVALRRGIRDTIDENLKRRGRAPVPAAATPKAAHAAPAAAQPSPSAAAPAAPAPSATAKPSQPAAPAEPTTPPERQPKSKPPLPTDLPRISLRLNATAAGVVHGHGPRFVAARPAPERSAAPAASSGVPAKAASPGRTSSLGTGPARPPAAAPTNGIVNGTVQKLSPIQHLLQQPDPPADPAAARSDDPPRPKLASRTAPVLPSGAQAKKANTTPPSMSPAAPSAPGPAGTARPAGWESIFDSGDQAVHTRPK